MNFKEATDVLFARIDHVDLALTLGVSVASIRQARLGADAKAFRSAPPDWREAVADLAQQRADRLMKLAKSIKSEARRDVKKSSSG